MNIPLLKRVKAAILKHPDQFEMSGYFNSELLMLHKLLPAGGCGTAACIAGWAVFLTRNVDTLAEANSCVVDIHEEAVATLGININLALRLFYVDRWPQKFASRYDTAKGIRSRARAAADRIDHFLKTKGAE